MGVFRQFRTADINAQPKSFIKNDDLAEYVSMLTSCDLVVGG